MRIASGIEALVARVLTADGVAGFGFTLGFEAIVAREMAAWDALARSRNAPFHALFGGKTRDRVEMVAAQADPIDPFAGMSLEEVRRLAGASQNVALLAPNAHAWEIAYCAAVAATLSGEVGIAVRGKTSTAFVVVSDAPGIDIDWSLEPGISSLRWIP